MKPAIIGLGFQRCGTSWLHEILNDHPQVSKPESGLHFFNRNLHRGPEWYSEQLARVFLPDTVLLEFTTAYSYPEVAPKVAKAIADLVPEARFLVSLREPTERTYSDFQRSVLRGEVAPGTLSNAIRRHPELLARSRYADILSEFLRHFPRERFFFVQYEEIGSDPEKLTARLYRFIGVDERHAPRMLTVRTGSASHVDTRAGNVAPWRHPAVRNALKGVPPIRYAVRWGRRRINRAKASANRTAHPLILDEDVRCLGSIAIELRPQVEKTSEITGLNLSHWLNPRWYSEGVDE